MRIAKLSDNEFVIVVDAAGAQVLANLVSHKECVIPRRESTFCKEMYFAFKEKGLKTEVEHWER